jgi:hypothetical protein
VKYVKKENKLFQYNKGVILVVCTVSVSRCKERKERRKAGIFKPFLKKRVPCLSAASERRVSMSGGRHRGEEEEEERNEMIPI